MSYLQTKCYIPVSIVRHSSLMKVYLKCGNVWYFTKTWPPVCCRFLVVFPTYSTHFRNLYKRRCYSTLISEALSIFTHYLYFYCRPTQILGETASSIIFIPNFTEVLYVVQQLIQCPSHDSDTHDCKLRQTGREREVTSDRRHSISLLLASVL
jgi:hypothetical protein